MCIAMSGPGDVRGGVAVRMAAPMCVREGRPVLPGVIRADDRSAAATGAAVPVSLTHWAEARTLSR